MTESSATDRMRWGSACSQQADLAAAVDDAVGALRPALDPSRPVDLVLAFFTAPHLHAGEGLAARVRERLDPGCFAAVSAHGVVSAEHEVETGPAVSLLAAQLPGVQVSPFLLPQGEWNASGPESLPFEALAPGAAGAELVLLIADPFTLDSERVLHGFHHGAPGVRVVGGMASAGPTPNSNLLILNDWSSRGGGFAIALSGDLRADVVVSQGCRPVGPALEVTSVEGNLLHTLDGLPALERAEQVLRALPEAERERLRHGLYVGRPARGAAAGTGDWLIRNLLGADRERGVLAVGDLLGEREKIRFHVRDAETAREDLEMLLSPQVVDVRPAAALLFACNSRGRGLYGQPDGDVSILRSMLGDAVPAAGMFCAGEIGPVGDRNFVHGHTASLALIRPRTPSAN